MIHDTCLKVLVVDDTVFYRKIIRDILAEMPGVEVVGTANNGKIAISRIDLLKPDLLTLDIEMPEMNGLEVLAWIKEHSIDVGAIMLSSFTREGGEMTMKALELGAFDFVPKPQSGTMDENRKAINHDLTPKLKAFARRVEIKKILKGKPSAATEKKKIPEDSAGVVQRMRTILEQSTKKSEIVGIGISTGGPNALARMLPKIPFDIGVPILIVQHMPPLFTQSLAANLNSKCSLEVKEAVDGQPILPNVALIAPGGKQMKVAEGKDKKMRFIRITDDPPEHSCKPSVDYLFRSISHHYQNQTTGVIMTGMGSDGTLGLKLMKRNGARVIAQDETTSVVYGMPREAIDAGVVDVVVPLDQIAEEIKKTIKRDH
jgi:two-component system chemotaxis response regulator CheB